MDHVIVRWESDRYTPGYFLDPRPYLEVLSAMADMLPPGARSFAQDPLHYDFYSNRCVKDLRLVSLDAEDASDRVFLRFNADPGKHASGLDLAYTGVRKMSVDFAIEHKACGMGVVQLDEVLPSDHGVSHEIQLIGGSIKIIAADLTAEWR